MPRVPTVRTNGQRIRELRLSREWSQLQLARLAGARAASTIRNIENGGKAHSSVQLVSQIARALRVPPSEITQDDPDDGTHAAADADAA